MTIIHREKCETILRQFLLQAIFKIIRDLYLAQACLDRNFPDADDAHKYLVGWIFYRSTSTINLSKFFKVTSILLVFVAAGVLSYGIHEFQEVGWFPGEDNVLLDLSGVLVEGTFLATLVAGLFNLKPTTTTLQVVGYVGYSVTVLYFLLKSKVAPSSPVIETTELSTAPSA